MKKQTAMYVRLSGTSRMKARKIMRAVQNVQIILVSLATIIVLSSSAFGSYIYNGYEYLLTTEAYAPTANWAEAVVSELGPTAEVVDWNIIKSEFGGSVDSLRSFLDGIGVTDAYNAPAAPAVTWNGMQTWGGTTRSYGINRVEGNVPSGYLIHDQIQNNWLLLGSWPANRQLVASLPVVPDNCPNDPNKTEPGVCGCGVADTDTDGDSTPDCLDNCPDVANADQTDTDGDGIGNECDNCPDIANSDQLDSDNNGKGDACESSCLNNGDCTDGLFCNGEETCVAGECVPGTNPCEANETCNETLDTCETDPVCTADVDCDDNLFCNGEETCTAGACVDGPGNPCEAGEICDESIDECICDAEWDLDGDCDVDKDDANILKLRQKGEKTSLSNRHKAEKAAMKAAIGSLVDCGMGWDLDNDCDVDRQDSKLLKLQQKAGKTALSNQHKAEKAAMKAAL